MTSDPCRDVLRSLTPSAAADMLAAADAAELAAERLSDALRPRGLTVIPSIGRDGAPYVLVCGSGGGPHAVVYVTVRAETVPEFIRRYVDPPLAG